MEAHHTPLSAKRYQHYFAGLTGLKAHGTSSRDIQPQPSRPAAIKPQCGVCLCEVIMAADLNWPVSGVGDMQYPSFCALVQRDFTIARQELTWDHPHVTEWVHGL
jgi:hypothetical protein